MPRMSAITAGVLSLLLCGLTGVGFTQQSAGTAPPTAPALKIGFGDLITITLFGNPDLSGQFRVDSNGDVAVPLIGHVHVVGETADQVAAQIQKLYVERDILKPDAAYATVFISEYATQGITVNGEIKNPGVYPALGIRMLNDVIAEAGGETEKAASRIVIEHRSNPGNPVTVVYNPQALKPTIPQVQIMPGDIITVPSAGIIYVLGDVKKPGGYVLNGRDKLSVEEAMALSGGGAQAASMNKTQLVRTLKDGRKVAITIPVNRILNGKATDVILKDGDLLYVPKSNMKFVAEQAITYSVSMGTQIAVYRSIYP